MPSIQVRGGSERDKELAAVGVRPRVGHGDDAGAGVLQFRVDLVVEGLAVDGGAAPTRARRVAALDHEVLDDPVKLGAVVVSPVGELGKVPARRRSVLPVHLQRDVAHTATYFKIQYELHICMLNIKATYLFCATIKASLTYVVSRMTKGGCQDFSGTDMMPQLGTKSSRNNICFTPQAQGLT